MKTFKHICAAVLAVASFSAVAQSSVSSYFLDGSLYNYKMNPAMKAERGYFSLLIGNLAVGTRGNVGLSDFIYPYGDDKLTTFMSGTVDQNEFLGKLPSKVRMNLGLNETIFAGGFRAFGGFASFDLSIHSSTSVMLPKGLFEFAKTGLQNNSYSFSDLSLNTMNYAAFTLGYSHEVIRGLRIGANVKYIAGLAHANVQVNKLNVELNQDHWMIESHATAQAALFCDAEVTTDDEGILDNIEIGSISAPTAHGFGIDLGVEYDLEQWVPGLTVSASIVDLGKIYWKNMLSAQSNESKVEFNGFNEIEYDNFAETFEDEFERLGEDAADMINLYYTGKKKGGTSLDAKMYIGAKYEMPFYRPLSVGLLYQHNFSSFVCNRFDHVRGYVNVAPIKWFSATVNYGYTSYGSSLGWMLNFHPAGFNFYIGSDYMITKVSPQFIPLNDLHAHLNIGISIALGARK